MLPYGDYILGTPEGVLHGESGLSELVEDHIGRPLRLYIYNNEYNVTREVTIQPSREWGGEGALGCVLGYGALHRLPAPLSEPVHAPGETMFDGDSAQYGQVGQQQEYQQQPPYGYNPSAPPAVGQYAPGTTTSPPPPPVGGGDYLIPAQMVGTPPPPAAPFGGAVASAPPRGKKKERPANRAGLGSMDDYFKEQERKSREMDNAPSRKNTPVPPPPMGGPPKGGPPKAVSSPSPHGSTQGEETAEAGES